MGARCQIDQPAFEGGATALGLYAEEGDADYVRTLLDAEADVHAI